MQNMEQRACELAVYMIENRATVRAAAKKFGISKSTVHVAVTFPNGFGGSYSNGQISVAIFMISGIMKL